ncbi:MAG TPA: ribonuclease P protein subunit [Candidatus Nitrosocosmicus sp.]|nr:ribonuclease P protein subunit [Candidatus Nitrosocosmicus sp.]
MQACNIIQSNEYFGRIVNVTKSRNINNSNRVGVIVNETKNMIFLTNKEDKKIIRIPKNEICEYEICHDGRTCTIDGKRLLGRPEELANILK